APGSRAAGRPSPRWPRRWRSRGRPRRRATPAAAPPHLRRGRPSAPGASGAEVETRLRLGTRTLAVGLVPEAEGWAATVDGAAHRVTRLGAGPRTTAAGGATVEELALEVDGRPHRALVARTRDRVLVAVAGRGGAVRGGAGGGGGMGGGGACG